MRRLKITVLASIFAIAACSGQTPDRSDDEREAEGEVLGGSISDAMLPLDQLKSQSPPIREAPAPSTDNEADDAETGSETDGADNAPPVPPEIPETPEI